MKKFAVILALFSLLVVPVMASAATIEPGLNTIQPYIGLGTRDVRVTVAQIINVAMGLLGLVAVLIILLGGFKWMTSMGDSDKTKKAKELIVAGLIGLVIILAAYAIANFVITSILNATT
ncbi:MAG: hypothetical protein WC460_02575 [Patescibacteria group bacterium]